MGYVKLELRCPKNAAMITSSDPDPLWTLDDLFSELNSLELQLGAGDTTPSPLKKSGGRSFAEGREMLEGCNKPFVMCISEYDAEDSESDKEISGNRPTTGAQFSCHDIYSSDSEESHDEMHKEPSQSPRMGKKSLEEGILFELESEHHLMFKEQLRNKLTALELSQKIETEKQSLAMQRLEKHVEARREIDKRLDKQYQRRIAEVLDNHLSILQRIHEQRSQIEERRIRDDAALEEARKERVLIAERLRQERAKAEAEARLNATKQAEAQKAALEAEKRAAKEAAEKEAARIREAAAVNAAKRDFTEAKEGANAQTENRNQGNTVSKPPGIRVIASEAALKVEANLSIIYNEVSGKRHIFAQKEISRHERKMYKYIKQIGGSVENVRAKAQALVQLINDPALPLQVSILIFANKVVSLCESPSGSFDDKSAFACGWVTLLVASQVSNVMDLVLAEFHRTCIYTVPKHLQASDLASQTKDYWKMLGYREADGKLESNDEFLNRVESCMKLYAALIQTEIDGVKNPHGLKEGWAWMAMFVNALPANKTTAVALEAFLKMAGFALHRRYKSQFVKVLKVISRRFLPDLKQRGHAVHDIVLKLEQYLDDKVYLQEPEDRRLKSSSLSKVLV